MQNIPTKIDGVSTLPASEFNQIPNELENIITDAGITLSAGDLTQLSKAVSNISGIVNGYAETGSANARILTRTGNRKAATAYTNGMMIAFVSNFTNTSSVTVNVDGLGTRPLYYEGGTAASTGLVSTGDLIVAMYDTSVAGFKMIHQTGKAGLRLFINSVPGITYSSNTDTQVASAVAQYAVAGWSFAASGTNTVALSTLGTMTGPSVLNNGITVRWIQPATNTGSMALVVNGLASTQLLQPSGAQIPAGLIVANSVNIATYNGTAFILVQSGTSYGPAVEMVTRTAAQAIPDNTTTVIQYDARDTTNSSTTTWYNLANSRYTGRIPGWYLVTASMKYASRGSVGDTGPAYMHIAVNGATVQASTANMTSENTVKGCHIAGLVYLNGTTDYIEVRCGHLMGTSRSTASAAPIDNWASFCFIRGN